MSHFTTVQTRIHDLVCLKQALEDLGYTFVEAQAGQAVKVRGYLDQKEHADLVIQASRTYDIGVRVTKEGVVFVADWWGVETTRGLTEQQFVHAVTQRYAYRKVRQELEKRGYALASEETTEDHSIHLKVRRF